MLKQAPQREILIKQGTCFSVKLQEKETFETLAIKEFCNTSQRFKELEALANTPRCTSLLFNVKNADTFIQALDLLAEDLAAQEFPVARTLFFFSQYFSNEASYNYQLPYFRDEFISYALAKGFKTESEDSIYCKP